MKATSIFLPALALGGAFLLVDPVNEAEAFSLLGHNLGPGQRDFRVFNNFADSASNNNTTTQSMFPLEDGAELAIWKAGVEWGSLPHGDGSGDPTQSNLGDGGANFDAAWMGHSSSIGGSDDNVVSAISSCGGGVLAYMEGPGGTGWRIRFCDDFTFADGPGTIPSNHYDLQAIQVHEYGHALGLGHSGAGAATMFPSIGNGSVAYRSIAPDDIAGLQAIYGVAEASKPVICETSVSGGMITIKGARFDPLLNDVWFRPSGQTGGNMANPRIRVLGVPSTNNGTEITVAIPAGTAAGDVLVKTSDNGGASISNAFPTDFASTISVPCPYVVTSISPSTMEPIDPGTAESVTVTGNLLSDTVQIDLNGNTVPSSRWSIVNTSTITIDMPLGLLGANTLTLSDADSSSSIDFTIVEPATPLLELGTGDPGNPVASGTNMNIVVAGQVGTKHQIYYSTSNLPSNHPAVGFDIGNGFTNLFFGAVFTVGPDAYTQFAAPVTFGGGSPLLFYSQSVDVTTPPAPRFAVSNVQSVTLTP